MYFWTSEAVSKGHPDKVADQIADAILDAHLIRDPNCRHACEVTLTSGRVILTGEVTSANPLSTSEIEDVVRLILEDIGYDRPENSFDSDTVEIQNYMKGQSPEIARAVSKGEEIGAGDQGIMFGYACQPLSRKDEYRHIREYMPLAHTLAFGVIDLLENDWRKGRTKEGWLSPFLPDAKSQVTIAYNEDGSPNYVDTVLISTCHRSDVSLADLNHYVDTKIKKEFVDAPYFTSKTKWLVNPAGEWNIGGPESDSGLSGRKIVVDNYGADCPVGGGSFSGKDPTKVDRSAAYAARDIAKTIVHVLGATECQVQLSYAIGVVEPVSIRVQAKGLMTSLQTDEISNISQSVNFFLGKIVSENLSLTPKGIIDRLKLREPNYYETASGGHFGRPMFEWEKMESPLYNVLMAHLRAGDFFTI